MGLEAPHGFCYFIIPRPMNRSFPYQILMVFDFDTNEPIPALTSFKCNENIKGRIVPRISGISPSRRFFKLDGSDRPNSS